LTGLEPRVTVALFVRPDGVSHSISTCWPGSSARLTFATLVFAVIFVSPTRVIRLPAVIPALSAGPLGTTRVTVAPCSPV